LIKDEADHPDHLENLIDAKRSDGSTALLLASQKKNGGIIELLIEAGADTMGSVENHLENKFAWDPQLREDGSVGYHCCHKMMGADKKGRCPAVAWRVFKTPDGVPLILLQEPHNHRSGVKRNADTGIQSGNSISSNYLN